MNPDDLTDEVDVLRKALKFACEEIRRKDFEMWGGEIPLHTVRYWQNRFMKKAKNTKKAE